MKNLIVEYNSNNSGGSWWLEDKDWIALESAGWKLLRGEYIWTNGHYTFDENGIPEFTSVEEYRYMGAVTKTAWKSFDTIGEALIEFEEITGQKVSDEGCNCCGAPHTFEWWKKEDAKSGKPVNHEYASGDRLLPYLYPNKNIPSSIREALESI